MAIITRHGSGPLGCWTLTEVRPRHLSRFIESIWYFEGFVPQTRERHFPNARFALVVQLGPRFCFLKNGTREQCATTCLTGLQTGPTTIESPPQRSFVLGVQLHPAGAYAILGSPVCETSDRMVDLSDLIGRSASELAERCDRAPTPKGRVRCAAQWVAERMARTPSIDPRVAWAASRIEGSHGVAAITCLQDQTGLSKKRFIRAFREQVGLAPKLYARIMRFRRALTLLHNRAGSLTDIALVAGYYDQPHMNLDFRELGGIAPSDYLAIARYSPTTTAG